MNKKSNRNDFKMSRITFNVGHVKTLFISILKKIVAIQEHFLTALFLFSVQNKKKEKNAQMTCFCLCNFHVSFAKRKFKKYR